MKIIDLLNKMANGEEVPKYVKYYDILRQKEDTMMCCYNNIIYKLDNNIIDLIDEVEIIEEKKIPEKLPTNKLGTVSDIKNKINEIIDYLKEKENK